MSFAPRKGFNRIVDIPPALRAAIDRADDEPRTLAEWLAVDAAMLLAQVAPEVGLADEAETLAAAAREFAHLPAPQRGARVGALLYAVLHPRPAAGAVYERIATHRSSVVREWGAQLIAADRGLTFAQRLACMRHYAADPHMAVREIAWLAMRNDLLAELDFALQLLHPWVLDPDANIRRCAVEGTRPRGVWCVHSERLKRAPELALPLLEPVRADPSRYVQLSVGNWLNDAAKSQPEWVRTVCMRWRRESPAAATFFIVQRALRTIGA
jgi:3-methyladenine DNA glycosylase AlkC